MTARAWSPDGWRQMPIRQVPDYPDTAALAAMEAKIARFPPLVFAGEARRRWRAQGIFRGLNRMLFRAGRPEDRWTVMRRFHRFPEPLIARFYAGALSTADQVRLLCGKPPVPIPGAVRALLDWDA